MKNHLTHQPAVTLTGLTVRTTNAQEQGPNGLIPALWAEYFRSGMAARAQAANLGPIYALYTDYATDVSGEYTVLIGHEAAAGGRRAELIGHDDAANGVRAEFIGYDAPDVAQSEGTAGLQTAFVPAGTYRVFTCTGPVQQTVPAAWGAIWAYYQQASGSERRTYTGDYEVYAFTDPAEAVVEIYIAVEGAAEPKLL